MEPIITIFDSENEIHTVREELECYSPREIVNLLQSTAIFRDVVQEFESRNGIGLHSVVAINGRKTGQLLALQVERGYIALYERLGEQLGEDSAALVLADINQAMLLEKCSD